MYSKESMHGMSCDMSALDRLLRDAFWLLFAPAEEKPTETTASVIMRIEGVVGAAWLLHGLADRVGQSQLRDMAEAIADDLNAIICDMEHAEGQKGEKK